MTKVFVLFQPTNQNIFCSMKASPVFVALYTCFFFDDRSPHLFGRKKHLMFEGIFQASALTTQNQRSTSEVPCLHWNALGDASVDG